MLVGEVSADGIFAVIEEHSVITRLGQNVEKTGTLAPDAVARTLAHIELYARRCVELGVSECRAVGTEVLRRADNSQLFLRRVREATGTEVTVITGADEAHFTWLSVIHDSHLRCSGRNLLILDIGGGSTELILQRRGHPPEYQSRAFGASSVAGHCIRNDPASRQDLDRLDAFLEAEMAALPDMAPLSDVVGVGGTVTTLAAMVNQIGDFKAEAIHGVSLTRNEIDEQIGSLTPMTNSERSVLTGLSPERADIILSGAAILSALMARYRQDSILVSTRGVRFGVFLDAFLEMDSPG